jgi:hypothetical protein
VRAPGHSLSYQRNRNGASQNAKKLHLGGNLLHCHENFLRDENLFHANEKNLRYLREENTCSMKVWNF